MKENVIIILDEPINNDCGLLTKLVFRSKASHGYSHAFMEKCRDEIRVTPITLSNGPSQLAWINDRSQPVGFVQAVAKTPERCELEALFVDPETQGKGIGQRLFKWAIAQALNLGFADLIINSDPGAERFYLAAGAVRTGDIPSGSIPGRTLPQLTYNLRA